MSASGSPRCADDGHFFWIDLLRQGRLRRTARRGARRSRPTRWGRCWTSTRWPRPRAAFMPTANVVFPFNCYLEPERRRGRGRQTPDVDRPQRLGPRRLPAHDSPRARSHCRRTTPRLRRRGSQRAVHRLRRPGRHGRHRALMRSATPSWPLEGAAESWPGDVGDARVRMGTLRAISLRLTTMRRQLGPAARDLRADRRGDRPGRRPRSGLRALFRAHLRAAQPRRRRHRRRLGLDDKADGPAAERDHVLADGRRHDLPAADLHDRFLRHELRLAGDSDRQRRLPSRCSASAPRSRAPCAIWFAIERRGTPVRPDQDAVERLVSNFRDRLK